MNLIIVGGRLTKDPETKNTNTTNVTRFSIAVDRRGKEDTADFFNCTAFGKTADFIAQYFRKGRKIIITGRLQNDNYTARDGSKRQAVTIIVNEAEFGDSKPKEEAAPAKQQEDFMVIPDSLEEEGLPFN